MTATHKHYARADSEHAGAWGPCSSQGQTIPLTDQTTSAIRERPIGRGAPAFIPFYRPGGGCFNGYRDSATLVTSIRAHAMYGYPLGSN